MTRACRPRIARLVSIALAAALALTGCGADSPRETHVNQASPKDRQFSELIQRPDIDEIVAHYQQMYGDVRNQLSAEFPSIGSWSRSQDATTAACGAEFDAVNADLPQNDAVTKSVGNWGNTGTISDKDWSRALKTVAGVVSRYGFDPNAQVMKDKPGAHDANFYDRYHAEFSVTAGNRAGFMLLTGCHLTAAAKQRARQRQGRPTSCSQQPRPVRRAEHRKIRCAAALPRTWQRNTSFRFSRCWCRSSRPAEIAGDTSTADRRCPSSHRRTQPVLAESEHTRQGWQRSGLPQPCRRHSPQRHATSGEEPSEPEAWVALTGCGWHHRAALPS